MRPRTLLLTVMLILAPGAAGAQDEEAAATQRRAHELFDELDATAGAADPEASPEAPVATNPEASPEAPVATNPEASQEAPVAADPDAPVATSPESKPQAPAPAAEAPRAEAGPAVTPDTGIDQEALADIQELVRIAHERQERQERRQRTIDELRARQTAEVAREQPACPHNRAVCRRFGVGFEAHGAVAPAGERAITGIGIGGLRLSLTVAPFLAVGVGQVGVAEGPTLDGERWAVTAAPYAELFLFAGRSAQFFLEGGVALQQRFGGRLDAAAGVAPFGGTGLRVWLGSHFTLSPSLRVYSVTSDGFLFSRRVLPRRALLSAGGLALELHF